LFLEGFRVGGVGVLFFFFFFFEFFVFFFFFFLFLDGMRSLRLGGRTGEGLDIPPPLFLSPESRVNRSSFPGDLLLCG